MFTEDNQLGAVSHRAFYLADKTRVILADILTDLKEVLLAVYADPVIPLQLVVTIVKFLNLVAQPVPLKLLQNLLDGFRFLPTVNDNQNGRSSVLATSSPD